MKRHDGSDGSPARRVRFMGRISSFVSIINNTRFFHNSSLNRGQLYAYKHIQNSAVNGTL